MFGLPGGVRVPRGLACTCNVYTCTDHASTMLTHVSVLFCLGFWQTLYVCAVIGSADEWDVAHRSAFVLPMPLLLLLLMLQCVHVYAVCSVYLLYLFVIVDYCLLFVCSRHAHMCVHVYMYVHNVYYI